jgi:hypothetical protein
MTAAVRAGGLAPDDEATMLEYLTSAADFMVNQDPNDGRTRLPVRPEPRP